MLSWSGVVLGFRLCSEGVECRLEVVHGIIASQNLRLKDSKEVGIVLRILLDCTIHFFDLLLHGVVYFFDLLAQSNLNKVRGICEALVIGRDDICDLIKALLESGSATMRILAPQVFSHFHQLHVHIVSQSTKHSGRGLELSL